MAGFLLSAQIQRVQQSLQGGGDVIRIPEGQGGYGIVFQRDKGQVLVGRQLGYQPIEGLYAAGNTCGMRFGAAYTTPIPGVSIGMALTRGRELGKCLAAK